MKGEIAIIGGSGVYNFDEIKVIREIKEETPFGQHSSPILELELNSKRFYFLPRHGAGHQFLPSEINYRANIFALKKLGVKYCISVSAVGSLDEKSPPESFVIPDQFIDWTKGLRARTFFGDGIIGHVSCAYPVEKQLQDLIYQACETNKINVIKGGTYICIEGPQFSSRSESLFYRSIGANVIGMTNVPEAYLAKEAGMAYATLAMITDFDCWKEEHCNVEEIMKVMANNYKNAQKAIKTLIPIITQNKFDFPEENKHAVLSDISKLSSQKQEMLKVLMQ